MTAPLEEGRFRYAHGIVWDYDIGQAVPRDDQPKGRYAR